MTQFFFVLDLTFLKNEVSATFVLSTFGHSFKQIPAFTYLVQDLR